MLTDSEILQMIIPYTGEIRKWHDDGLVFTNKIADLYAENDSKLFKRIRGGAFNNYVLEKARRFFETIEGVNADNQYESLILRFDVGFTGRFKKRSSHIKNTCKYTTRNKNYIQGTLYAEYPDPVSLEINYSTNEVDSEITQLSIIKRVNGFPLLLYIIPASHEENAPTFKAMEVVPVSTNEDDQISIKKSS